MTSYSALVMRRGAVMLDVLRSRGHASTDWLAREAWVSIPTARRALAFLREVGCPLTYSPKHAAWLLADRSWSLPLFELRPAGWVPADKAATP